jgi:LPS-assembly protein
MIFNKRTLFILTKSVILGYLVIGNCFAIDNPNDTDLIIEGESLENTIDKQIKASGNAVLIKSGKRIEADTIIFDQISNQLEANGNVKLKSGNTLITGQQLTLDVDESVGEIPEATFDTDTTNQASINQSIRGYASKLSIEGENKTTLNNAEITTCEVGKTDWFIKGSEINIDNKSKSVDATNARMEFKGVPIMYSPKVNFSFNNERKTGFLSPTWGTTTRSGFQLRTPYYFNIAPNQDATVTPRYMGKRGLQIGGQYRYLNDNSAGEANVEFLNNDYMTNQERYLLNLKHKQNFTNNFSGFYRYEKVSDNDYFADMSSLVSKTSRVILPQEFGLDYRFSGWNSGLRVQKFQSLTSSSPYEKLPQIFFKRSDEFMGVNSSSNFEYTEFDANNSHNKFVSTDLKPLGYSDGDLKPTGSRFVYNQAFTMAIIENSFSYVKPKISLNYRHYDINHGATSTSESLLIPTASVDSGLYFDRTMNFFGNSLTQTLEPRVFYSYTPFHNQSMLPIYDTRLMDLNLYNIFSESQFIGSDRIEDTNQLTTGLTSRIIDSTGIERVALTFAQRFYLSDRNVLNDPLYSSTGSSLERSSSDFIFGANARITKDLSFRSMTQYNPEQNSSKRVAYGFKYNPQPGKLLKFDYRFIEFPSTNETRLKQFNLAGQWPLGKGYYAIGRYNFDLDNSKVIESLGGMEYDAGCWSSRVILHRLSLATEQDPNYTLWFQLELGGLGSIGSGKARKLDRVLMRNVPGASWASSLDDDIRRQNYE